MVQYRQLAFLKKFSEMHSWPGHFNNIATVKSEYRFFPLFFHTWRQLCYKVVYKVVTRLFTRLLQGWLLQDCCCVNCILVTRLQQGCCNLVFSIWVYTHTQAAILLESQVHTVALQMAHLCYAAANTGLTRIIGQKTMQ